MTRTETLTGFACVFGLPVLYLSGFASPSELGGWIWAWAIPSFVILFEIWRTH